jgi:hypothetical protein
MRSIQQLTDEVLSLPETFRSDLLEKLMASLAIEPNSQIQDHWLTEVKRRRADVASGSVTLIPGDEALEQVRRMIQP